MFHRSVVSYIVLSIDVESSIQQIVHYFSTTDSPSKHQQIISSLYYQSLFWIDSFNIPLELTASFTSNSASYSITIMGVKPIYMQECTIHLFVIMKLEVLTLFAWLGLAPFSKRYIEISELFWLSASSNGVVPSWNAPRYYNIWNLKIALFKCSPYRWSHIYLGISLINQVFNYVNTLELCCSNQRGNTTLFI